MFVLQNLINGLLLGGVYALVAVGFSLVWGVMNLINISHGALVMIGAYVTFWLYTLLGLDPFLTIPLSMLTLAGLGALLQHVLLNQIVRAPAYVTVTITFGLAIFLEKAATLAWSADFRSVTPSYAGAGLILGPLIIPGVRLAIFGVALVLTALLYLFDTRTRTGQAIRATRMDIDAAQLVGIRVRTMYLWTFALGAAMAGAAGSLISIAFPITPVMGGRYLVLSFVIVVLGGLGSIPGALLGGLAMGVIETLGSLAGGASLRNVWAFVILVLVLLVRPTGILGRAYYK